MKRKPNRVEPASDQHRRFIETACQLECDEDKERFEEKLGRIAKVKALISNGEERGEEQQKMKEILLIVCIVIATEAAYGQQQQQPQRFTTCSQAAEYAKQICDAGWAFWPTKCLQAVETNRANCMATGTYQKTTAYGGTAGPPITNLRRE
jgi:hypothetical protein